MCNNENLVFLIQIDSKFPQYLIILYYMLLLFRKYERNSKLLKITIADNN